MTEKNEEKLINHVSIFGGIVIVLVALGTIYSILNSLDSQCREDGYIKRIGIVDRFDARILELENRKYVTFGK